MNPLLGRGGYPSVQARSRRLCAGWAFRGLLRILIADFRFNLCAKVRANLLFKYFEKGFRRHTISTVRCAKCSRSGVINNGTF